LIQQKKLRESVNQENNGTEENSLNPDYKGLKDLP